MLEKMGLSGFHWGWRFTSSFYLGAGEGAGGFCSLESVTKLGAGTLSFFPLR